MNKKYRVVTRHNTYKVQTRILDHWYDVDKNGDITEDSNNEPMIFCCASAETEAKAFCKILNEGGAEWKVVE